MPSQGVPGVSPTCVDGWMDEWVIDETKETRDKNKERWKRRKEKEKIL